MKDLFNKLAKAVSSIWSDTKQEGRSELENGRSNKGTAFTKKEREDKNLTGLLPYKVSTQKEQKSLALAQLRKKKTNIEKYVYLSSLQDRNERLFYDLALENIEKIMPLIYTPTVGEACKEFANIFREPKGMYITPDDKGKIRDILDNWPEDDIRNIVITDGERILGLGDLGANGMGIPIGKLALYSLCGGLDPKQSLPIMFDIGTNNKKLREDPRYLGYPHERLSGAEYDELMDEFIEAVKDKFPKAMVQFEDFLTPNAHRLLSKYRDEITSFNDDIQGTASVVLGGLYASTRITGDDLKDMNIMFLGAGSAATGSADLIIHALMDAGLSEAEAKEKIWFVDSKGLVTSTRTDLSEHKKPYARDYRNLSFEDAIKDIQPNVLIGATGFAGSFKQEIVELMSDINDRPVIFALSNPTSHAECSAEDAYKWSDGRAIFASGSPFDPVTYNGQDFIPGQSNNSYIFPGLGLGINLSEASYVSDEMFLEAAKALANSVSQDRLNQGALFPPLSSIREVSANIAKAVIKTAQAQGHANKALPYDLDSYIQNNMYDPSYEVAEKAKERAPAQKRTPKP